MCRFQDIALPSGGTSGTVKFVSADTNRLKFSGMSIAPIGNEYKDYKGGLS